MTTAVMITTKIGSSPATRYAVEPEDHDQCVTLIRQHGKGAVAQEPSWRQDPRSPEPEDAVERKNALEEAFGYGGIYARRIQSRNRVNEMLRSISISDVVRITTGEVHY